MHVWVVELWDGREWFADALYLSRDVARFSAKEMRAWQWKSRVRKYIPAE